MMETGGPCPSCSFETARMIVGPMDTPLDGEEELARALSSVLTADATSSLPAPWQGDYPLERARQWLKELEEDASLTPLLVTSKTALGLPQVLGVVLTFDCRPELRLGYILRREAWGKGLGTEVVQGLLQWLKNESSFDSVAAGVGGDNIGSQRVLEKCGFQLQPDADVGDGGELHFSISLKRLQSDLVPSALTPISEPRKKPKSKSQNIEVK
ncbi:unnamed protein product [Chrysoparadoxa australica]